jgi:hypothetical protein
MKQVYTLSIFLFVLPSLSFAQDAEKEGGTSGQNVDTSAPSQEAVTTPLIDMEKEHRQAIAIDFGAQGFGLDYGYSLNRHFAAHLGYMMLPVSIEDYAYDFQGTKTQMDINVKFSHMALKLDYYPFAWSGFKLMAGVAYFINNEADVNIMLDESIYFGDDGDGDGFGDFEFTPDEVGNIDVGVDWKAFNPYFGFGFGRAVPDGYMDFGMDMGMFYMGSPNVTVEATQMLEDTAKEEEQLQSSFADYKWLPQLNFRISFRF